MYLKQSLWVFLILIIIFIGACDPLTEDGGTVSPVVEGTITVADTAYWSYIKVGLFSGGSAGDYPNLDYYDHGNGVDQNRLTYVDLNNGTPIEIPTDSGHNISISSSGVLSRTYSVELSPTLPLENEYLHMVCWYDNDQDGKIDLIDSDPFFSPDTADDGEFNRLPTLNTTDQNDDPTTIVVTTFQESYNLSGEGSGKYKYAGYNDNAYNEQLELNNNSPNTGFDFDITNNIDW